MYFKMLLLTLIIMYVIVKLCYYRGDAQIGLLIFISSLGHIYIFIVFTLGPITMYNAFTGIWFNYVLTFWVGN